MGIVPSMDIVPPEQGSVLPVTGGREDGAMETTGGGGLSPAGAISTDPRGMPVPEGGGAPVPAAVKLDPTGGVIPLAAQEPMPLVPIPPPSNIGAGDWPVADPVPGQAAAEPGEDAEPPGLMPCPPSSVEPKGTPTAPTGDPTSPMGVSAVMPGPKAGPAPMDWARAEPHIETRITRRAKGEGCNFMSTSRAPREPPATREFAIRRRREHPPAARRPS